MIQKKLYLDLSDDIGMGQNVHIGASLVNNKMKCFVNSSN